MPKRRTDKAAKALRSTARGNGAGPSAEPGQLCSGASPVRPLSLAGRAADVWDQFAPALVLQGMLTERDTLTFALWCRLAEKVEAGQLSAALITQFRLLAN